MISLTIFFGVIGIGAIALLVTACNGPFCYNNEGPYLFWAGIILLTVAVTLGYLTL